MKAEWVDGFEIRVTAEKGETVISANREGMLSLAKQLKMLADMMEHLDRKRSNPYTVSKIRKLIGAGRKTQVHLMAGKFLAFPVFRRI